MNHHNEFAKLSEPFRALLGNSGLNHQFYDLLPIPIEIFAPDGTCIFVNRAMMEFVNASDAGWVVGTYNLKHDPVCLAIIGQENMDKIFRGAACSYADFPVPIQDVADRGAIDEKPFEAAIMDIFVLPLWDGDTFVCTTCFFTVKNMYQGRNDIAMAQEYMETHWQDEFDLEKLARLVGLSSRHFRRIFKEIVDETPLEFYQRIKLARLKERLLDDKLSIEQAFEACGVDSHGAYHKYFKEETGMSPSEYRKANTKK